MTQPWYYPDEERFTELEQRDDFPWAKDVIIVQFPIQDPDRSWKRFSEFLRLSEIPLEVALEQAVADGLMLARPPEEEQELLEIDMETKMGLYRGSLPRPDQPLVDFLIESLQATQRGDRIVPLAHDDNTRRQKVLEILGKIRDGLEEKPILAYDSINYHSARLLSGEKVKERAVYYAEESFTVVPQHLGGKRVDTGGPKMIRYIYRDVITCHYYDIEACAGLSAGAQHSSALHRGFFFWIIGTRNADYAPDKRFSPMNTLYRQVQQMEQVRDHLEKTDFMEDYGTKCRLLIPDMLKGTVE